MARSGGADGVQTWHERVFSLYCTLPAPAPAPPAADATPVAHPLASSPGSRKSAVRALRSLRAFNAGPCLICIP